MFQRCVAILAWLALGFIVFVTLSPIGLRPTLGHDPIYERIAAYAFLGLLFGLAYPNRLWITLSLIVGTAIILEGLQNLTPDRHGHLRDLVEKVSGSGLGVTVANAFSKHRPRL
jgi:hypothetical protein